MRPGGIFKTSIAARPWAALELEPSWSIAWLRSDGALSYRETAARLLIVWHIDSRQNLRAILQHAQIQRRPGGSLPEYLQTTAAATLTYSYRHSTSTVLYAGAARASGGDATSTIARAGEVFIKIQFDLEETRVLSRGR